MQESYESHHDPGLHAASAWSSSMNLNVVCGRKVVFSAAPPSPRGKTGGVCGLRGPFFSSDPVRVDYWPGRSNYDRWLSHAVTNDNATIKAPGY